MATDEAYGAAGRRRRMGRVQSSPLAQMEGTPWPLSGHSHDMSKTRPGRE